MQIISGIETKPANRKSNFRFAEAKNSEVFHGNVMQLSCGGAGEGRAISYPDDWKFSGQGIKGISSPVGAGRIVLVMVWALLSEISPLWIVIIRRTNRGQV